jgi:hypothetical protein
MNELTFKKGPTIEIRAMLSEAAIKRNSDRYIHIKMLKRQIGKGNIPDAEIEKLIASIESKMEFAGKAAR